MPREKKTDTATPETVAELGAEPSTAEPAAGEPHDPEPTLENPNHFHALTIDEKVKHLWERDQWKSRQLERLTAPTPAPLKETP